MAKKSKRQAMAKAEEAASTASENQPDSRPASPASSGQESTAEKDDAFEDAVDAPDHADAADAGDKVEVGSFRSLTKRSVSSTKESPRVDDGAVSPTQVDNGANEDASHVAPESESKAESRRGSSPLSKRFSNTSNLDNLNLDDETAQTTEEPTSPRETHAQPAKTLSLSSITNALPNMPWSPPAGSPARSPGATSSSAQPPAPNPASKPAEQHPPPRKLTGAFSWLSRNSSSKDVTSQPPAQTSQRRNTASSIATLTSNPEMMLSKLEEESEDKPESSRASLKDRFKLLRMQQEAGIPPEALEDEKPEGAQPAGSQPNGDEPSELASPPPIPTPTADLAPGTASGVNAGPSAMLEAQVDWDLWQSVVYEGPAVVARTSAEELNRAIATGIPNAIRGVIWQVLAQSKSPELESTYRDLVVRGTDKEKNRRSNSTTASASSNSNANGPGSEAVESSASSVKSDKSGGSNASSSSKGEKAKELSAKAQAAEVAERKRKEKEDAAALQKLEKTIRRDLGARTSFSKYAASAGLQDGLFGVCKAYALYDEGVGYAQGMNFMIMPLLFNMPEEEAFSLLVRLMQHYHLRELFIQDMPGLHMRLHQFERLLEDFEPALYCHLRRRSISPHLYATQWFLTLFAYRFPLQLVLRIYDLILSEGLTAILRFGIALMQKNATTLLGISDMQQLTTYLKDKLFDVYIDKDPSQGSLLESGFFGSSSASVDKEVYRADQLVKDATEVKITPEALKQYTMEWEEKTKADKDRETELHELRMANQNYAGQVRKLEERAEAGDREQAALATEVVHTKVENQELKDENESLKVQVRELRNVIEKQPAELEEAWKMERDNLMERNEKVHEENRKIEQEMAELEEELVQTKMRYAEINSQHETLNRKWSDLKKQFA